MIQTVKFFCILFLLFSVNVSLGAQEAPNKKQIPKEQQIDNKSTLKNIPQSPDQKLKVGEIELTKQSLDTKVEDKSSNENEEEENQNSSLNKYNYIFYFIYKHKYENRSNSEETQEDLMMN